MTATASSHPEGRVSFVADSTARDARWEFPPSAKHAITRITNAAVFIAEVSSCARLPHRTPRHWRIPNPTITETAMIFVVLSPPARAGISFPLYSPMTMATAARVPQLDSQSLQPTMKPAYSPMALREKLYWPPLRGMAAPSSAMEDAPNKA